MTQNLEWVLSFAICPSVICQPADVVKSIQGLSCEFTCRSLIEGTSCELWSEGAKLVSPLFLGISSVALSLLWSIFAKLNCVSSMVSNVFAGTMAFSLAYSSFHLSLLLPPSLDDYFSLVISYCVFGLSIHSPSSPLPF